MKFLKTVAILFATLTLFLGGMQAAEAKRLGGGGSFGSKFSYNNSVQRKAATPSQPTAAQTQNATRSQQLGKQGGMMGLLGGLALGGLLGALFFGGAFENINLFDILVFGGIIFLLVKFMGARRPQPAAAGYAGAGYDAQERQGNDHLFGGSAAQEPTAKTPASDEPSLDHLRGDIPRDFAQKEFLDGANACFSMLQQAWDSGELAELRRFTTDHVFAELQDQIRARGTASTTEVDTLDAELLKVTRLGSTMEASVLFTARMVEDGESSDVQEIWHFVRQTQASDPNWQLDGIQQVAD